MIPVLWGTALWSPGGTLTHFTWWPFIVFALYQLVHVVLIAYPLAFLKQNSVYAGGGEGGSVLLCLPAGDKACN